MDKAINEFKKKFKSKTGNAWEDRDNFEPQPRKYQIVDMADEDSQQEEIVEKSSTDGKSVVKKMKPCTLPKPTQELIKLIFDNDMFKEQLETFEIDVKKMPLGKISKVSFNQCNQ